VNTGVAKYNRAVRVVTGWLQDQEFQNEDGQPGELIYGDADDSFNLLVKRHGGDVPARALLDELVRVGTVKHESGKVQLQHKGYVPHESETALLEVFATSATDLLETLDHNLSDSSERRLQMSVAYDNVTNEGRSHFRKISADKAMSLLRLLDGELSPYDRNANKDVEGDGRHRIGLGVYLIEQALEENHTDD